MIIPIRCFTCGNVIGDKWNPFIELITPFELIPCTLQFFFIILSLNGPLFLKKIQIKF